MTMKTKTLFLACAMALLPTLSNATVRRVNYVQSFATSCLTCYYGSTSFQQAIDASIDGDTIHVEPSDFSYGDVSIAKRLVVIGAGYKLGAAPNNSGLQANTQTSMVRNIALEANSDGSRIMGLHFPGEPYSGLTMFSTSNIIISRNFIVGIDLFFVEGGSGVNNVTIAENFINGGISQSGPYPNTITNLTIRNNYFSGNLQLNGSNDEMTNVVVTNNTFDYNGTQALTNAEVAYNVFHQGNVTGTNNTIHDNITAAALTGADLATNPVVSMGNVYNLSVGSDDTKWDILSTSGSNEYVNGVQQPNGRGMYSGANPYRKSGIPNIPTIYTLQTTVNTIPNGSVEVTLSTRSNP